jgi:hypothetical protein
MNISQLCVSYSHLRDGRHSTDPYYEVQRLLFTREAVYCEHDIHSMDYAYTRLLLEDM